MKRSCPHRRGVGIRQLRLKAIPNPLWINTVITVADRVRCETGCGVQVFSMPGVINRHQALATVDFDRESSAAVWR